MYRQVKQTLLRWVPRSWLFRFEPLLRGIYAQWYRGRRYRCNLCGQGLRTFIHLENGEQLCPRCGSIARDRRLWQLLSTEFLTAGLQVLDFSPSRCLYRAMKNRKEVAYLSTDVSGDFIADRRYDITSIPLPDASVDLVICYHVLEHVEADEQAMAELFRILKRGGRALIQTPFRSGAIYEDAAIISPEDRLVHFGQEDHVRIYSVSGLEQRLTAAGFRVMVRHFESNSGALHVFAAEETILIAEK